ncbi:MAG: response regulator [Syntrophomonadaceae bacterium]|nr:response regulator [Syntrophomonadaceae bacterium]
MYKGNNADNYGGPALRVLIVEDDAVNLLVISRLLEKKGYVVETAVNGQKALSILGNDMFDIVLMDISMPKIDGLALTKQMKKNSHTQNIPIVAMTTFASLEDREKLLNEGLDAYIAKPVDPSELYKIILQLTSADSDAIDQNGLIMRTDGDREFMRNIAAVFCRTSTEAIDEIKKSTDLQVISGLAHKLKGSAETAGALKVTELARQIKSLAEKGNLKNVHKACASFQHELDMFKKSLMDLGIVIGNDDNKGE